MKKFKNIESERFMKAVESEMKKRKLSQNKIAEMIGYKNGATFTNIKAGTTSVQVEQLLNFCEQFGYKFNSFFDAEIEEPTTIVAENRPAMENVENKVDYISQKFEAIEQTNEMFLRMFETGIQLTKNNSMNFKELRGLIGA